MNPSAARRVHIKVHYYGPLNRMVVPGVSAKEVSVGPRSIGAASGRTNTGPQSAVSQISECKRAAVLGVGITLGAYCITSYLLGSAGLNQSS